MPDQHHAVPPPHPILGYAVSSERGGQLDSAPPSPSLSNAPALPSLYSRSPGQMAAPRLPSIPSLLNTPLSAHPNAEFPLLPTSAAPSPAGAPPTGSLDANLRQLALLQALVARQQALVESSATPSGRSNSTSYASSPRLGGHSEGASSAAVASASFDNSLMSNDWSNVVEGLNHSTGSSADISAQGSPNPSSAIVGLGGEWPPAGVTANELAVAQQQLDLWSQTVFTTDSPTHTQPSTPAATPASPPSHSHLLHHQHQHAHQSNTPFDWNTLYSPPSHHHSHGYAPLPPTTSNAFAHPSAAHTSEHQYRANGLARGLSDDSDSPPTSSSNQGRGRRGSASTAAAAAGSAGRNRSGSHSAASNGGGGGSGMATRGGGRRSASRAVKYVEEDEDLGDEEMDPGPLQNGTPEEIEEDKRRRNTAASARFRAKKKQRDQQLQQTSVQLREKVQDLEKEKTSLKAENTWLRDLVSERSEISPKIRELLISQQRG